MISAILVVIAAIMNSIMDKLTHHWDRSVFITSPQPFWASTLESWKNKYIGGNPESGRRVWKILGFKIPIHPAFTDGWHLAKSVMVVILCASVVLYKPIVNPFVDIIILGAAWNITFNLFYNKIL
jgi:hypothetical protein